MINPDSLVAAAKATSAVGVKPAVGTAEATPTTMYRQGRGSANSTSAPTKSLHQRISVAQAEQTIVLPVHY